MWDFLETCFSMTLYQLHAKWQKTTENTVNQYHCNIMCIEDFWKGVTYVIIYSCTRCGAVAVKATLEDFNISIFGTSMLQCTENISRSHSFIPPGYILLKLQSISMQALILMSLLQICKMLPQTIWQKKADQSHFFSHTIVEGGDTDSPRCAIKQTTLNNITEQSSKDIFVVETKHGWSIQRVSVSRRVRWTYKKMNSTTQVSSWVFVNAALENVYIIVIGSFIL